MPNPFNATSRAKAQKTRNETMRRRGTIKRILPSPVFPELTPSQNVLLAALWIPGTVLGEFGDGWVTWNKNGGRHGKPTKMDTLVLRDFGIAVRFGSKGAPPKWQLDPALREDVDEWRRTRYMETGRRRNR